MKYYHFIKYTLMIVLLLAVSVSGSINAAISYSLSGNVLKFQQRLAKKGDPYAQYRLGVMYESGLGVDVDYDEALKWYVKSSRLGNPAATRRINYIDILKEGYKPEEDETWLAELKQDANADDGEATLLLGVMYKSGIAVDKDLNMSHRYLKRAVVKDVSGAEDELAEVKELIEAGKEQEQEQEKLDEENENRRAEEVLLKEKEAVARKKAEAKRRRLKRERRKQQLAKREEKAQRKKKVLVLRVDDTATLEQKADNAVELQGASVEAGKGLSWAEAVELERKKQETGN